MSPFRYQYTRQELADELGVSIETVNRRKVWTQEHYKSWRRVFLYGGLIDIREWQKMIAAHSEYQYEAHRDSHLKIIEGS